MRSIKQKILVQVLALVVAAAVICGGVGIAATYISALSLLEENLRATASLAADRVAHELAAYQGEIEALGMVPELSDDTISVAEKERIVDQWAQLYGMERGNLLDRNGDSLFDGNNYSEREYFQHALQGEAWISTPTMSKITGELSIMVAAPVWEGGVYGGSVDGVVYFVPPETFLNDIMTTIRVSENSGAYMIDSTGLTVADTVLETVAVQNIEAEAQSDPSLSRLAALHADMRVGNSGYGRYAIDGTEKCLAYAPVSGTNGWSIGVNAPVSDFLGTTYISTTAAVALLLVILVVAFILSVRMAKGIGDPIKACAERLALVDTGDLSSPVPEFNTKDEVGTLSRATTGIVTNLQELIGDVDRLLDEMAKGNFNVRSRNYDLYQGDYTNLLESVRNININLSETLSQINQAADQVSAGAEQVSLRSTAVPRRTPGPPPSPGRSPARRPGRCMSAPRRWRRCRGPWETSFRATRRSLRSSRPLRTSPSRPTFWPSTRRWRPPGRGAAARASPWWPTRCATWPRSRTPPPNRPRRSLSAPPRTWSGAATCPRR